LAIITQEITVEVAKPNYFQALVAKQGDINSRFLKVTFAHNGEKIEIKSTSTAMIGGERPDGQSKTFAGEVNADGTATVPLVGWMLELTGLLKCDVTIVDVDGRKLSSTSFKVMVDEAACSDDDITTDDNYDILTSLANALEGGEEIIKACEEATAAATEATQLASSHPNNRENPHGVTAAQIGAAPSGYGLGGANKAIDDWNNATENGWYSGTGNSPTGYSVHGFVIKYYDEYIVQRVWSMGSPLDHADYAQRVKTPSGWQPWEWVTPPLEVGVEYRTTERYQGKAVYVKMVPFGTLPNNNAKSISMGLTSNNIGVADYEVIIVDGVNNVTIMGSNSDLLSYTFMSGSNGKFEVATVGDKSNYDAWVKLKYIYL
jgi:hypothetical protein